MNTAQTAFNDRIAALAAADRLPTVDMIPVGKSAEPMGVNIFTDGVEVLMQFTSYVRDHDRFVLVDERGRAWTQIDGEASRFAVKYTDAATVIMRGLRGADSKRRAA